MCYVHTTFFHEVSVIIVKYRAERWRVRVVVAE